MRLLYDQDNQTPPRAIDAILSADTKIHYLDDRPYSTR